jgi:hypothetical protein
MTTDEFPHPPGKAAWRRFADLQAEAAQNAAHADSVKGRREYRVAGAELRRTSTGTIPRRLAMTASLTPSGLGADRRRAALSVADHGFIGLCRAIVKSPHFALGRSQILSLTGPLRRRHDDVQVDSAATRASNRGVTQSGLIDAGRHHELGAAKCSPENMVEFSRAMPPRQPLA